MALLQQFLSTVEKWFVFMCRSLCVSYWKGSCGKGLEMALLRPGGQWSHVEETHISWPVLCLLGPVICVVLAVMVLHGSDSPGFLHSGQGAVLKVGRCGPFPQATAWS